MKIEKTRMLQPLAFKNSHLEKAYRESLATKRAKRDAYVWISWALLWVAILARNRRNLTIKSVTKSFMSFTVITSPSWLQLANVLPPENYRKQRAIITTIAKTAFVFHAGGGIYREGMAQTATSAFPVFIQLVMASRVLFWLVLQFGYSIDW